MEIIEKTVEAKIDNLQEVLNLVEEQLELHEASMKVINIMCISVEEIFANVCMYAYSESQTIGNCTISIWFENDDVIIKIVDDGFEFNPLAKEDPDIHASVEDRGVGGLGIYMVKQYMDSCTYDRIDNQNIFTMRRTIK